MLEQIEQKSEKSKQRLKRLRWMIASEQWLSIKRSRSIKKEEAHGKDQRRSREDGIRMKDDRRNLTEAEGICDDVAVNLIGVGKWRIFAAVREERKKEFVSKDVQLTQL